MKSANPEKDERNLEESALRVVTFVLLHHLSEGRMKIVEYLAVNGASPFRNWFDRLDSRAAAKVTTALTRMGMGSTSNVESVGGGVYERKIDYGPGYRVYFGMDGEELVILVVGAA